VLKLTFGDLHFQVRHLAQLICGPSLAVGDISLACKDHRNRSHGYACR
jgi:hypothetical protein